jgi:hypothetical protein
MMEELIGNTHKPNGSLGTETQFIQHEGSGIKQSGKAHVHATYCLLTIVFVCP